MTKRLWCATKKWVLVLTVVGLCAFPVAHATGDEARYVYDDLGRLFRVIDAAGNVAQYNYDAVGNLLSITRTTASALTPQITGVTPDFARAPSSIQITLTGSGLIASSLLTDNPGISAVVLRATETVVVAALEIDAAARLGSTVLTVDNGVGQATVPITVYTTAPAPTVNPEQVTIKADGGTAQVTVGIAQIDTAPVILSLTIVDPTIASISTGQIVIPAGSQTAAVTVTGKARGWTNLTVSSGGGDAAVGVLSFAFTEPVMTQAPPVSIAIAGLSISAGPILAPNVSVRVQPLPVAPGPILAPPVSLALEGAGLSPGPVLAPSVSLSLEGAGLSPGPILAPPVSLEVLPP